MNRISLISLLTALFAVFPSSSRAATKDDFVEAAKKDREVVFYTTTNVEEADAMSRHFRAKYPFIDVNINRAEGERIVTKVLQETRAKKSPADVIQTPAFYLHALRKREIIGDYVPADNRFYPRNFKEENFWTTTYYNPYVVLYNTKLVSVQNLPKRYEDLLNPFWKNKMIIKKDKIDWFTAIRLFVDFLLSKEGQQLYQSAGRLVARSDLSQDESLKVRGAQIVPVDPAWAENFDEDSKLMKDIFSN